MNPTKWFWALIAAISIGGGCDSSPVGPLVDLPAYRVGQRWIYVYDAAARDSTGALLMTYHDSLEVRVVSVTDELFGIAGLVRMDLRSLLPWFGPGPAPDTESVWYTVTTREMVEHAYRNPGAVPIVQTAAVGSARFSHFGRFFDPLSALRGEAVGDSIQRRDDPRKVLVYPLSPGMSWDSCRSPFYQKREVVEVEPLNILGRVERTARIRTTMPDMDMDLDWEDWISPRGLMRRVLRISADRFDENLNYLGTMVNTETAMLVAME